MERNETKHCDEGEDFIDVKRGRLIERGAMPDMNKRRTALNLKGKSHDRVY